MKEKIVNKHAYLIMAHGNWQILRRLFILLDDARNDIYLHIDAKIKVFPKDMHEWIKQSKLTIIEPGEVYWSDFSEFNATLKLMKKAYGGYSYYHLLSGVDLPIKSKDEIYNFFETSRKEFIGIVPNEVYYSVRRVKFYHPFLHNRIYRKSIPLKALDRFVEYVQKFCGVNRLKGNDMKIIDGWQWFSITDKFCKYILEKEDDIKKMFSYSIACTELVMQTLAYNSDFINDLYDTTDLKNGSMRFIDWGRGRPYTWGADEKDFNQLIQSPYMFARKFDEQHFDIVEKIFNEIDRRNHNEQ